MADPTLMTPTRRGDGLLELRLPNGQTVVGATLDEIVAKANELMRGAPPDFRGQAPLGIPGRGGVQAPPDFQGQMPLSPPGGGGALASPDFRGQAPLTYPGQVSPEEMQWALSDMLARQRGPQQRALGAPWDEMFR